MLPTAPPPPEPPDTYVCDPLGQRGPRETKHGWTEELVPSSPLLAGPGSALSRLPAPGLWGVAMWLGVRRSSTSAASTPCLAPGREPELGLGAWSRPPVACGVRPCEARSCRSRRHGACLWQEAGSPPRGPPVPWSQAAGQVWWPMSPFRNPPKHRSSARRLLESAAGTRRKRSQRPRQRVDRSARLSAWAWQTLLRGCFPPPAEW